MTINNVLSNICGNIVITGESLKKHTTFGIGGNANTFVLISSLDALSKTVKYLKENNIKYIIIGDGTNLLVSDNKINDVVIKLDGDFKTFEVNNEYIRVGAAVSLLCLAKETLSLGFGGLETIGSVPGTVGGAAIMNAGVRYFDFSTYVHELIVVNKAGDIITIPKDECDYSYRESLFQYNHDYIIAYAVLKLEKTDTAPLKEKLAESLKKRVANQPQGKCAGCFFKNKNNYSSGKLIEECSLKGMRVNGAYVSDKHANFIMNDGTATAKDVLELANKIKDEIKKQKNIELEFEVRLIGDF